MTISPSCARHLLEVLEVIVGSLYANCLHRFSMATVHARASAAIATAIKQIKQSATL